jgi:hypothetical protein
MECVFPVTLLPLEEHFFYAMGKNAVLLQLVIQEHA